MTIEQWLKKSAKELEALSDKECDDYFKQFYPVTRPDQIVKETPVRRKVDHEKQSKKHIAEQILFEALGRKIKL